MYENIFKKKYFCFFMKKTIKKQIKTKSNNNYLKIFIFLMIIFIIIFSLNFFMIQKNESKKIEKLEKAEEMAEDKSNEKNSIVVFDTNYGEFEIEVYENLMPITSKNFIGLINSEFYDNQRFHRVIDGFMIQGGDPNSKDLNLKNRWGTGGSKNIEDEFVSNPKLTNEVGTISMANSGRPNSGSSQFFINVNNNSFLDFDKKPFSSKHPVFGKIINGLEVVLKISRVGTNSRDMPLEDVIIKKVYVKN